MLHTPHGMNCIPVNFARGGETALEVFKIEDRVAWPLEMLKIQVFC